MRYSILDILLDGKNKDWIAEYTGYKKQSEQREDNSQKERNSKRVLNTRPSLPLGNYCGLFTDPTYGDAEIALEGDSLVGLPLFLQKRLLPVEWSIGITIHLKIKFKDAFLDFGLVTFSFNANGEATGFKIDLPSNDFHFGDLDFQKKN